MTRPSPWQIAADRLAGEDRSRCPCEARSFRSVFGDEEPELPEFWTCPKCGKRRKQVYRIEFDD